MYLSRLILNPRSRAVRRDVADCQAMHRTVLAAFPAATGTGEAARRAFGVLYRLDGDRRTGRLVLYVQSRVAPDWTRLPADYLLPPSDGLPNPACKAVDEQYARLRAGDVLAFRLCANPTKRVFRQTGPDGKRWDGKRVELRREADQIAWLHRKAAEGGFEVLAVRAEPEVPDVRVVPAGKVLGWRRDGGGEAVESARRLTFYSVVFEGRLRIVDAERFRATLASGIGPAKAYGFGLLTLAPPRG